MKPYGIWWLLLFFLFLRLGPAQAEQKIDLATAYQKALNYNETIAISEQEIKLAEARYRTLLGTLMPRISFTAYEVLQDNSTKDNTDDNVGSTFTRFSRPQIGLNLQQNLFQGLRQFQTLKKQRQLKAKDQYDTKNLERLLFQDVAFAYYHIILLERQVQTEQKIVDVVRLTLGDLKKRVDLGKSRLSELAQQESEEAIFEADLEKSKGDLRIAYDTMSFLTGLNPMPKIQWKSISETPLQPIDQYVKGSTTRPDYLAAKKDVEASKTEIKINEADLLPRVDLDANYYVYRVGYEKNINWDAEVNLNIPVFDWINFSKIQEAKIKSKQTELQMEATRRIATDQIRRAYDALIASRNQLAKFKIANTLSQRTYDLQIQDFRSGLLDSIDLFVSQRTLFDALKRAENSEVQTWLDWVNLLIVSGDLP